MRHPVLFGEHELTIDEKNRLPIPADVRKAIPAEFGEALFIVLGMVESHRVPFLYPERYYEELAMQAPADLMPGEEMLAFDQLHFAMADKRFWDKQGRIVLPDKTLKRASIGKEVTLVGVRDHLELWNRSDWEVRREELFQRSRDIQERAKAARQAARQL